MWLKHLKTAFESRPRDALGITSAYDKWYVEVQLVFTDLYPNGVDAGSMPSNQYVQGFKSQLTELHAGKPWPDSDGTLEQKAKALYDWSVQWWRLHPCVAVHAVRLRRGNSEDFVTYMGEVVPLIVRHGRLTVKESTIKSHAAQKSESGGATEESRNGRLELSGTSAGGGGCDARGPG